MSTGASRLVDVAAKERPATGEHARELAESRQAFIGVHLHDAVLGHVGGAERGAGDFSVGAESRDVNRGGLDRR